MSKRLLPVATLVALVCSGCATAFTENPTQVSGTDVRIAGTLISTVGGPVEWWVEYGETPGYGSESTHFTASFTQANQPQPVRGDIDGLERSTTYHYRLCAQDAQQQGGPGCGEDRTFTTTNLGCGDVITQDFVLSGSTTCSETGLVVGAPGIDINLNGNAILGPEGRRADETTGTGVDNSAGHDDVTLRNGGVPRWGTAVDLEGASFNVIRNVDMSAGNGSVIMRGGESNTIRSAVMTGTRHAQGLDAIHTDGLVVADSSGTQWSLQGDHARIVRNVLGEGFPFFACLAIQGNRNRIADNRIGGCPASGLTILSGGDNVVIGNELSDAPLIDLGDLADGIWVGPFTAGTLLEDNFVHENFDDGIDVRATATRLKDNRAEDNGGFGIDAVAGVTDLGGNTASGNGSTPQCRNVSC